MKRRLGERCAASRDDSVRRPAGWQSRSSGNCMRCML